MVQKRVCTPRKERTWVLVEEREDAVDWPFASGPFMQSGKQKRPTLPSPIPYGQVSFIKKEQFSGHVVGLVSS
jgi:hypothetical protein